MFMNFSINEVKDNFDELTLHFCDNGTLCNGTICQKLFRVSSTRYLGLMFDNHLRWNLHVNNKVMRLRSLNYSFYKLRKIVSVHVMRTVYLALYQAIFQYGLLIWGGLSKTFIASSTTDSARMSIKIKLCWINWFKL